MDEGDPVFVTGATGFIGTRLVQALTERGMLVRALSRQTQPPPPPGFDAVDPPPLEHERVQLVLGDILDPPSLLRGMQGCRWVFHLAGYAKNWARDPQTFERINVQGMRNAFQAAKQAEVQRIVWTSSIVTLGPTPPGTIGDERMPRITECYFTEYERSKTVAEQEALRWAADGFPVVIVNPTRVYGPGHLTEGNALARLIDEYDRGRAPILLDRGQNVGNYVLVDDVVQGHLLAMQRGRVGERYILGGENVTLKDFFRTIDRVRGKRHRQIPLPGYCARFGSWLLWKRAEWFGVHPTITPGWVRTFQADWAFHSDKAIDQLGYQPTPLEQGLRLTLQWIDTLRNRNR